MPADKSKDFLYEVGERVLCFHGPLLYEAKVMAIEIWDKSGPDQLESGPHYFVHYKGWKQTWDEWLDDSRILKYTDDNLQKQKYLKQAAITSNKKKSSNETNTVTQSNSSVGIRKSSGNLSGSTSGTPRLKGVADGDLDFHRGRKRGRDSIAEKVFPLFYYPNLNSPRLIDGDLAKKPEFKFAVPNVLKVKLIDDWEFVTKEKLLVNLPRTPTVSQIIDQYNVYLSENAEKRKSRKNEEISKEILVGLKHYFDKALGTILLYRFERYQYQEILQLHPDSKMSDIYGAEHLLRLFVQLPALVSQANMDDESLIVLKDYLSDFLKYLQKNISVFFVEKYKTPSPSYVDHRQLDRVHDGDVALHYLGNNLRVHPHLLAAAAAGRIEDRVVHCRRNANI
ncbi:Chromatin modification-related protein eaf3 [Smittium culicis]|uniref:Chromatin modification-related protein EAF3 n=1 Tax=Smittium culicis TaxID=133412 RepID=A0A1R1YMR0_9FUNG|nr:Chromatin modification-related protein eaf3 [Smittium culicis]